MLQTRARKPLDQTESRECLLLSALFDSRVDLLPCVVVSEHFDQGNAHTLSRANGVDQSTILYTRQTSVILEVNTPMHCPRVSKD